MKRIFTDEEKKNEETLGNSKEQTDASRRKWPDAIN